MGLLLAALMVLALGLRCKGLASRSLWVDEVLEAMRLGQGISGIAEANRKDVHPPLRLYMNGLPYFMAEGLAAKPTGPWPSEFQLRLVPCILGILSVGVLVGLLRNWMGWAGALVGGYLLTINTEHVEYSQDGRMYSASLFFSLLTLLATDRLARALLEEKRVPGRDLSLFLAATAANVANSYLGLMVFALEIGFLLLLSVRVGTSKTRVSMLATLAMALLGSLPWIGQLSETVLRLEIGVGVNGRSLGQVYNTVFEWFSHPSHPPNLQRLLIFVNLALLVYGVMAALARSRRVAWLLLVFGLGPLFGLLFLDWHKLVESRYFLLALPACLALQAFAFDGMIGSRPGRILAALLGVFLTVSAGYGLRAHYQIPKQEWKLAVDDLVGRLRPDSENLIMVGPVSTDTCLLYYLRRAGFSVWHKLDFKYPYSYEYALVERGSLRIRLLPPSVDPLTLSRDREQAGSFYFIGSFPGKRERVAMPSLAGVLDELPVLREYPATYPWGRISLRGHPHQGP